MKKFKTVNEFMKSVPAEHKPYLTRLRELIREAAPEAEEVISYGMPAYKQNGILVYFCLFNNHYGFFPGAGAIVDFADRLEKYSTSKGTIRLPFDKPLPVKLIKDIVKYRLEQNSLKKKLKSKAKKS